MQLRVNLPAPIRRSTTNEMLPSPFGECDMILPGFCPVPPLDTSNALLFVSHNLACNYAVHRHKNIA